MSVVVGFRLLSSTARAPSLGSAGAACWDLTAPATGSVPAGASVVIPLGIALEVPAGYEAVIRGRSGNSSRGLVVLHGTVDSDYRGEIGVILSNTTTAELFFSVGARIAQLAIRAVPAVQFVEVAELSRSARGARGFGSTGGGVKP